MSDSDSEGREPRKGQQPAFNLKKYNLRQSRAVQKGGGPPPTPSKKHHRYGGTAHISKTIFGAWKASAAKRGIRFNLTIDDVEDLWVRQNEHCAVTGRTMTFTTKDRNKVSLDRVDCHGDYSRENVRLVCSKVNIVRNDLTDTELEKILEDMKYIDNLRNSYGGTNWYTKLKRQEYRRIFGADPPGRKTDV